VIALEEQMLAGNLKEPGKARGGVPDAALYTLGGVAAFEYLVPLALALANYAHHSAIPSDMRFEVLFLAVALLTVGVGLLGAGITFVVASFALRQVRVALLLATVDLVVSPITAVIAYAVTPSSPARLSWPGYASLSGSWLAWLWIPSALLILGVLLWSALRLLGQPRARR
jgi:hypothetical protein